MAKYKPIVNWQPDGRVMRAICGMCPDVEISPSLPGARAHLFAHPTHVVAMVTTSTTLLSMVDTEDEPVATPVDLTNVDGLRVPA